MPIEEEYASEEASLSTMATDAVVLYGLQGAASVLPLVTLGYLARTLGPSGLGLVAYGQAMGGYLNLVIEYGFHLTLTREVARNRSDPARLSELLAAVWGAKALLSLLAIPLLIVLSMFGEGHSIQLALTVFAWSAAQSFNLIWYLHGTEQIRFGSALDIGSKFLAAVAIILTVKSPAQILWVFIWQALAALLVLAISIPIAYRGNQLLIPRLSMIGKVLRLGWSMFVQRGSSQFYSSGTTIILGVLRSTVEVGLFSGPDRVIRGAVSLFTPILHAVYPRVSRSASATPARGTSLAAIALLASVMLGFSLSVGLYVFAPSVIRLALGRGFESAIPIMRTLAFLPILRSITISIGFQWMIPFGYDGRLAAIYVVACAAGLALTTVVVIRSGAIGAARVTILIEAAIVVAQLAALRATPLDPIGALCSFETGSMLNIGFRKVIHTFAKIGGAA